MKTKKPVEYGRERYFNIGKTIHAFSDPNLPFLDSNGKKGVRPTRSWKTTSSIEHGPVLTWANIFVSRRTASDRFEISLSWWWGRSRKRRHHSRGC